MLDLLTSPRFCDDAPRQIWATLLDEGQYHCSVSTMYRILRSEHAVRERRDQLRHPSYAKPELLATAPNQVWSWDITKLLGPAKWTYFYLYVIMDIFSRYVVGWMVAHRESATLARQLIAETCVKQSIAEGPTYPPRRSRLFNEIQTGRPTAGRSRRHQNPFAALCFR